jgi:hypothetical protein
MAATQVDKSGPLASAQWRSWVRDHPLGAILIAGFAAVSMATLTGSFYPAIGIPQINWPQFTGTLVLNEAAAARDIGTNSASSWGAGFLIHFIDGVVFALLFAVLLWRKIPLPNTTGGNVGKGLIYSWILGLISIGILIPYVYLPKLGLDPFSFGFDGVLLQNTGVHGLFVEYGDIGWKLPFGVMLWHTVYGFVLGALYDPSD